MDEEKRRGYINLIKFDENGYPICEEHGSMNAVNKDCSLFRCSVCHVGIDIQNVFRLVERLVRKH